MAAKQSNPIQAIKDAVQAAMPGLDNIASDLTSEFRRQATQGTMEIAALLFGGNAFVQYGPGQHTPQADQTHEEPSQENQLVSEGMER